jgi:purine nucleosidase
LDTDIGTDVDDLVALAMIPGLPDVDLLAVTTVYGDTDLRARIAAVACARLGVKPRIAAGEGQPLSGRPVFWGGHEGAGIDGLQEARYDRDTGAVALLHALAAQHAGRLEIVAIGPLTNLATAILADPSFVGRVAHLTVMGGDFGPAPPRPEHNFLSDAIATWIVLRAGIPTTICGYEITTQVLLRSPDIDRIERSGPAGALVADQTRRFWRWREGSVPPGRSHANSPHDPMALLTAFRPDLFRFESVGIEVVGADGIGGNPEAGSVRGTPELGSHVRVVRDADFAEVKEAVVASVVASVATSVR